ncbi:hypothetical protein B0I35DRAFT_432285 [Stachybotrys elegans]|uniref:Uncharacterized protein n=1 Tax=Stachybotrys elegans TaxID=80388 RepID=A0A8K0SRI4_9HYPO|nr:hypothetical protein B0I35DRAFT_432285 [Stachybotrys elegans]
MNAPDRSVPVHLRFVEFSTSLVFRKLFYCRLYSLFTCCPLKSQSVVPRVANMRPSGATDAEDALRVEASLPQRLATPAVHRGIKCCKACLRNEEFLITHLRIYLDLSL